MSRHFGGASHIRQGDRTRHFTIVALVAVLVLCLFAAFAFLLLSREPAQPVQASAPTTQVDAGSEVKMVDVLVPLREVAAGTALEPAMFRRESRPSIGLSGAEVHDFEEIKGQFSRSMIVTGVPLHKDYLTNIKPTSAITASIPPGFRAVTIRVDERTSVEGYTRPGARVDVSWGSKINGSASVSTIVQNAKVLSAQGGTADGNEKGGVPGTITLLVTERDAAKIQLASTSGTLSLSLRGDTDTIGGEGGTITIEDLTGGVKGESPEEIDENIVTVGGQKFVLKGKKLVPVGAGR